MGSWKGRGNQYIEFARVLYCKLPTNGKQLTAFPLEAVNHGLRGGRRECCHSATVAPYTRVEVVLESQSQVDVARSSINNCITHTTSQD